MPSIRTLTVIELNGIGFSDGQCEKLKDTMKGKLESIENECYRLAKHTFSLTSTDDIARVLFLELGLPPNGNVNGVVPPRQTRSNAGGRLKQLSTCKSVLEKLVKYHRLPKLILEWRRVNSALTKVVYPLQRMKKFVSNLEMDRIYSEAQYHTSTGRVTFSEPNLQNVPKEFYIKLPTLICESPPSEKKTKTQRNKTLRTSALRSVVEPKQLDFNPNVVSPGEAFAVSMRSTFIPLEAAVFIAADYCQLELRLIAHLSADVKLIETLNDGSLDVFKSIAARINHVSVEKVTATQRQHAKQICYGIIYGIGAKALGEQLNVSEEDAAVYMEQFKDKYSGIKSYIRKTIDDARINGFVKTLGGRKRLLPAINSSNSHAKAQAERQAVNTTVQGSAADLVKIAMNSIDDQLNKSFGSSCLMKRKEGGVQRGAFLVLQLHDELLYEVNKKDIDAVENIIQHEMEHSLELTVNMPVKMKIGTDWGNLKDVKR